MNSITAWVDVLGTVIKTALRVVNISRDQVIGKLTAIRENLEQFKEAADRNDASKMRQLLESCKAQSEELEKGIFQVLDDKANASVKNAIKRARIAKSKVVKKSEIPTKKQLASSKEAVQAAAKAKSAGLEQPL